jgi:hypothetical protein
VNSQQTPEPPAPQACQAAEFWGNSGPGGPPLPRRKDDRAPRTPSAVARREEFARRHPEILVTARREGARLMFDVLGPGKQVGVYQDADVMMDDLEARYP